MSLPVVKLLVIGESNVGKSCLLLRYTDNKFEETFMQNIGVDFKTKHITIDSTPVKLQIWDTAGSEKFRSITKAYFRGAHGFVVTFDLSEHRTFEETQRWIEEIRKSTQESDTDVHPIAAVLVGNKSDLERAVTREEAQDLAREYGIPYFETSAKDGTNVESVFTALANEAFKQKQVIEGKRAGQRPQVTVLVDETQAKDECAC
jgi:small GTP-binding protein